jgi:transcriptional regulator of acetoin/glycerol metabolism
VLAPRDTIEEEDLLLDREPIRSAAPASGTLQEALDEAATARIRSALAAARDNRTEAARELGVDRTTLYRLMRRFGI